MIAKETTRSRALKKIYDAILVRLQKRVPRADSFFCLSDGKWRETLIHLISEPFVEFQKWYGDLIFANKNYEGKDPVFFSCRRIYERIASKVGERHDSTSEFREKAFCSKVLMVFSDQKIEKIFSFLEDFVREDPVRPLGKKGVKTGGRRYKR